MKAVRGREIEGRYDTMVMMDLNEYMMLDSMLYWFIDNNKTPTFARMDIIKRMHKDMKKWDKK
jgi:hypothetical protein